MNIVGKINFIKKNWQLLERYKKSTIDFNILLRKSDIDAHKLVDNSDEGENLKFDSAMLYYKLNYKNGDLMLTYTDCIIDWVGRQSTLTSCKIMFYQLKLLFILIKGVRYNGNEKI